MDRLRAIAAVSLAALSFAVLPFATLAWHGAAAAPAAGPASKSATPIQHVIIIMQENRSFDHYFGTFPGAQGFPQGTCVPLDNTQPQNGCVMPFHDRHDVNAGGPHGAEDSQNDADDGITTDKMDGFVLSQTNDIAHLCHDVDGVEPPRQRGCAAYFPGATRHDVMGYHTDAEIPNYWAYAKNFVLQDNMFEGMRGWSLASHLDLTSEWSAACKDTTNVATCNSNPVGKPPGKGNVPYPWVNLFQLLDLHGVSWKYYLAKGTEPDCDDDEMTCDPQIQNTGINSLWNPAPGFAYVHAQGTSYIATHNPSLDQFLADIKAGTLPQVSWVIPSTAFSEHPASGITAGMEYVTSLVNAVMQSPYWANTAIFISWDDWGGFYDHVAPPNVDFNSSQFPVLGFGFRVPGIMISAYAKAGYVDHHVLDTDSYATLFEDLFMDGTRLDPVQLGEPDNRPDIRDKLATVTFPDGSKSEIGKLIREFNFNNAPLPPLILSTHIPVDIEVTCGSPDKDNPENCGTNRVRVSWHAVAGPEVKGPFTYQVFRDGVAVASCATAKSVCFDSNVPSGQHFYTVLSQDPDNVSSPQSAAAEADVQ